MADTTVCSSESPSKSSDHKATIRKSNKPLMEKKRRARINSCLTQLKSLVLQALKKDTSQFSKLEKADILEMTVKHLKSVQQQHMSVAMATDPNVLTKYRAGFNECAGEVMRYLGSVNGLTDDTRTRVLNHLAMCMQSVNTAASVSLANQAAVVANQNPMGSHMGSCGIPTSLFPAFSSPPPQPQSAHVPPLSALTVPVSSGNATHATLNGVTHRVTQSTGEIKPQTSCSSSLQLIPGTLPSGQLAFFVASPATIQTPIQAIPVYTAPSSDPPTPVSSPEVSPRVNAPDTGSATIPHGHILSPAANLDSQDNFYDSKSPTLQHSRLVEFYRVPSATETSRPATTPNSSPPSPFCKSPYPKGHPNRSPPRESGSERDTRPNPNDLHEESEEKVWRPW